MLEAKTKMIHIGKSTYILIPQKVCCDSAFPLKKSTNISIRIEEKKVVIEH